MTFDTGHLLEQDVLTFTPRAGEFDMDALAAGLAAIGSSFRDETRPERFVLTPDIATRDALRDARRADPASPFPFMVNVEAHPDQVLVWPATYLPELKALSRQLIEWLTTAYECDIENDDGTDMSDRPMAVRAPVP